MTNRRFQDGDEVVVAEGDFKGQYGTVLRFEDVFERYLVMLPDVSKTGYFAFQEHELEPIDFPVEEVVDQIEVPEFGMTTEQVQNYLEYLFTRSLAHVGEVGAKDAFFGYQQWEGKTASQVLVGLMFKLEEGMAMFAQAHILIGRTIAALESVHDQEQ